MIRKSNSFTPIIFLHYRCCFILHNVVSFIYLDYDRFKMRYELAILRGNDKNATNREKHVGSNVAKVLIFILGLCSSKRWMVCESCFLLLLWPDNFSASSLFWVFINLENRMFIYVGILYCERLWCLIYHIFQFVQWHYFLLLLQRVHSYISKVVHSFLI